MRIIFICGSLEPGKDGVGDYSFQLAKELLNEGHQVSLIAFYDKHISKDIEEQRQPDELKIAILRLSSSSLSDATRLTKSSAWINSFTPDWLSLQFVPYAFNKKGLPFKLPNQLNSFRGSFKWHIMFHESWIIPGKDTSFVNRLISLAQKHIIKKIIKKLQPKVIQTTNDYYKEVLKKEGIQTSVLPLPSNIPVSAKSIDKMKEDFASIGIEAETKTEWVVLGLFGAFRKNVDLFSLISKMFRDAQTSQKKVAFLSIGRSGPHQSGIFSELKNKLGSSILIHSFGEREADDVSAFFQLLDFGVSAVPASLVGKSGGYAAMKLHDVKVLIPCFNGENYVDKQAAAYFDTGGKSGYDYHPRKIMSDFIGTLNKEQAPVS